MKLYQLYSKQAFPISQKQAWDFLSNPANLKVITPDHMGFNILSGSDRPMFPGQIIQYKVSPIASYSTKWVTEITHVKKGEYFVDEQRFGPYAFWHHKHFITPIDGGIEIEDIIDFKIPYSIFGQLAYSIFIKKQLEQIFSYREEKLIKLFGLLNPHSKVLELKSI